MPGTVLLLCVLCQVSQQLRGWCHHAGLAPRGAYSVQAGTGWCQWPLQIISCCVALGTHGVPWGASPPTGSHPQRLRFNWSWHHLDLLNQDSHPHKIPGAQLTLKSGKHWELAPSRERPGCSRGSYLKTKKSPDLYHSFSRGDQNNGSACSQTIMC